MGKAEISSVEQLLLEEVTENNVMEYTTKIIREVRLSGTPEEYRSFEYVKEMLDGFGLSTQLLLGDTYISLPVSAALQINGKPYKCITHSMVPSTGDEGITSEAVYVKRGTHQDYQQLQARGKIVLVDGLASSGPLKTAQEVGAIGVIFINTEYTHEMIISDVWGSPTPETIDLLPKIPAVSVNRADGESIKKAIESGEKAFVYMKTEVDTGWRKIPTLVAEVRGSKDPEKYVMLSGHIDSWHLGAMDNGGANAMMMEVGRILSKYRDKMHRSLRIFFWSGHSHGRYAGSTWYCDTHWEDVHENCVLHINTDSIGGLGNNVLVNAECMAETRDLATDVVAAIGAQDFVGHRKAKHGDQSFFGSGAPTLYGAISKRIPSKEDLATGGMMGVLGWWWHTTEDTIDKVNPANLVRDTQIFLATVYRACSEVILPINQVAAVREMKVQLIAYQEKAGNRLDFTTSLERMTDLENQLTLVHESIENQTFAEHHIPLINQTIKDLSKLLVPLNYVRGNKYEQDAPGKYAPIPCLSEVEQLGNTTPGSDSYFLYKTLLIRRLNQVNHTLTKANRAVAQLLKELE